VTTGRNCLAATRSSSIINMTMIVSHLPNRKKLLFSVDLLWIIPHHPLLESDLLFIPSNKDPSEQ